MSSSTGAKDEKESGASATNTKPDLGLLEEDDEFEEFPAEGQNAEKSP